MNYQAKKIHAPHQEILYSILLTPSKLFEIYLFRVTKVPVNFLHLRKATSRRSGSSFKNVSSRQTLSISFERILRRFDCKFGKRIFNSATVLLVGGGYK